MYKSWCQKKTSHIPGENICKRHICTTNAILNIQRILKSQQENEWSDLKVNRRPEQIPQQRRHADGKQG